MNSQISKFVEGDTHELSDKIKIIKPNEKFIKAYNLELNSNDSFSEKNVNEPLFLIKEISYIQVQYSGFVCKSKYISTNSENEAIDIFKSFLGIAIAIKLLNVNQRRRPLLLARISNLVHVHQEDSPWKYIKSIELNQDFAEVLYGLDINSSNIKSIKEILEVLALVLSQDKFTEKLMLSAKWYFESFLGNNELLSFIQTMVALEILFGDKKVSDLIGIGRLLGNRCAYFIGKNFVEREEILEIFDKIYEIRSNIVHSGKKRLTQFERDLYYKLKEIVSRAIQEELFLIYRNNK
ncbi:MAG: hypothetical protein H6936_13000 [Burkholderiales bacterium]|nr:hypothetical protein [Burkholderiales bacterium]